MLKHKENTYLEDYDMEGICVKLSVNTKFYNKFLRLLPSVLRSKPKNQLI